MVFKAKNEDYGPSWKILRMSSLTDQILIKASRIRSIEEKGSQEVSDPIDEDYMGLINYSIIALMQMTLLSEDRPNYSWEHISDRYHAITNQIRTLLEKKNSDYGEIWREMQISSYTDMILMKVERLKQIHQHNNQVKISEGMDSIYQDIVNYSIFALIKWSE